MTKWLSYDSPFAHSGRIDDDDDDGDNDGDVM